MIDLEKILTEYEDLGLTLGFSSKDEKDGTLEFIQLIDVRSFNWEVVFEITKEQCNVMEFQYDNDCQAQSNEVLPTFEAALELASNWC